MLTQLSIHQLRNLNAVNIKVGQCNVFVGPNGSGKTSLLESVYLLSRGKSFRHHQPKRYISHHAPYTTVFAKFSDGNSIAIQKAQDASTILRLSQQTVYVQSALTKQLPTLLIDPSSMDILEIGSGSRRQLLDWITFHVKPGFHAQWQSYQRLLKQRNTLLKQSSSLSLSQQQELASWDKGLATHADLITHYRRQVFEDWQPLFENLIQQLLPDYAPFIQLRFMPGYDTEVPLDQLLSNRLQQDCQMGYTRIGCHRSDLQVLWVDNVQTRNTVQQQQDANKHIVGNDTIGVMEPNLSLDINKGASLSKNNQQSSNVILPIIKGISEHDIAENVGAEIEASEVEGSEVENLDVEALENENSDVTIKGIVREQATHVLSRGEKKLLITALRLSQLPLLSVLSATGNRSQDDYLYQDMASPVVLLDDITAELDARALTILLSTLSKLNCQVFITSVDDELIELVKSYWQKAYVFHVKQGDISQLIE